MSFFRKIHYNAPVILTFAGLSLAALALTRLPVPPLTVSAGTAALWVLAPLIFGRKTVDNGPDPCYYHRAREKNFEKDKNSS